MKIKIIKLWVIDNIIVIKKGTQSFIRKSLVYFFQYLIIGRLDGSYYDFQSLLKTGTTFAVLGTDEKIPAMKERLNKSANCFEISFF